MNRPGHGPNDFEDRLRAALRRRAEEVTPDPSMWARVKERAARRRRSRWLGAAATVTPLLAAVAVSVALGLPDRKDGVDLADLGPVATATSTTPPATPAVAATSPSTPPAAREEDPPAAETVTAAPQESPSGGDPQDRVLVLATAPGLVVSDANAEPVDVVVTEPAAAECAQDVAGCEAEVVSDVHARPGSSASDLTLTFLESFEPCMGAAGYAIRTYGAEVTTNAGEVPLPDASCPAAPIWSPDGTRLAWLERAAAGDRLELVTVPWLGDPGASPTPATVARATIPGDLSLGLEVPRIVEWASDASGAPVLYVTGGAFGEEPVLYRLGLTADPATTGPSGPLTPVAAGDGASRYLTYASAGGPGPAYLIDRAESRQDGRVVLQLVVSEAGDGSDAVPAPALDLPAEVVDPSAPGGGRVWLRARGGEVLLGDGVDDAWRARWDGTAWGPLEALPGAIRSADFLEPAGS